MSNMFYDMTDTAENIDKVVHELIETLKEEYVDNIIGIEEEGGVFYLKPRSLNIPANTVQELISNENISWDASEGNVAKVTLTSNATLLNVENLVKGVRYTLFLTQDNVGNHTISFDTNFSFLKGAPDLSTAAGSTDVLEFICLDGLTLTMIAALVQRSDSIVVNNLISTSITSALSANMGRELNERITEVADAIPDEIFEERLLEILYPISDWAPEENIVLPLGAKDARDVVEAAGELYLVILDRVYKYNRELGTITQKPSLPATSSGADVIGDGNYLYVFGDSIAGNYNSRAYRYNVLTGVEETLPDTPTRFSLPRGVKVGRYIYFFKPNSYNLAAEVSHIYRFNLDTFVYERLADAPVKFHDLHVTSLGNEIYVNCSEQILVGDTYEYTYKLFYKFNVDSEVWTKLPDFADQSFRFYRMFAYGGKIHGVPDLGDDRPGFTFDPIKLTFEESFVYPLEGTMRSVRFEDCCVLGGAVYFKIDYYFGVKSNANALVKYTFETELVDSRYIGESSVKELWEQVLDVTSTTSSTTETKTNQTWLDGKPIYRKLFEIPNANLTAGSTQIALDVLNAETITNLHATIEYTASTSLINVNSYWCSDLIPITTSQIIKIECTDGNLEINKQNDMSTAYKNLKITVEFTKTTD